MALVYKEVEVEINLDDFDTDELIEELRYRGKRADDMDFDLTEMLRNIYELRRLGKDYQQELDEYIYNALGKIV